MENICGKVTLEQMDSNQPTKEEEFWKVSGKTQVGSWMRRKMLKLTDVAKTFHMKAVRNGCYTYFWYDRWSVLGVLSDILEDRGTINMSIRRATTMEDAIQSQRRKRSYRVTVLNDIAKELESIKAKQMNDLEDVDMWRWSSGFKPNFSTRETWLLSRESAAQCSWARSVWFPQATQSLHS